MTWVDTHCHLHMSPGSVDAQVERARAAGVAWIVCPGTDAGSSEASFALADQFPDWVLPAAGLHPHEAGRWESERARIGALAEEAVAIGECGLDFYRNLSPPEQQREAFRDQLQLGVDLDKPVIVHCRDAFRQVHEDVAASGHSNVVLHCWTGGPKWTKRFLDLGVIFSFAGPITYRGGDTVRRAAAEVAPDRTLVETDSPFLTPPPDRSRANEPANVVRVGEALAEVWGIAADEVAAATTATASRVFRG